jgi:poly(ADP-ribose) glycohydrolase ARH3
MPFEGARPESAAKPLEMQEARLGRGTYTDDTEMMIALAEVLVEHGTAQPEELARRFLAGHDPARGYGGGTLQVFDLWRQGIPVEAAASRVFGGRGSFGNGAAMRVAPVGVLFADRPGRLVEEARRSAAITHAHPVGTDSAIVQAVAVGAAVRGDEILGAASEAVRTEELRAQLALVREMTLGAERPSPAVTATVLKTTSAGHESVPAALYSACVHGGFEDAVSFAVRLGGDADTIGAMTGTIAGAAGGVEAIPERWLRLLENGPRGRSYVEEIAFRLAEAAGSTNDASSSP